MDLFYLGDVLRGLNLSPTLKVLEGLGMTKKKGEKFIKLEEFYPLYAEVKKSKDQGSYEDFVECLKLYDKQENGTMMMQELEHILLNLGEKLEREDVDTIIKECCDPEDDDGFIPYERKAKSHTCRPFQFQLFMQPKKQSEATAALFF